MSQSQSFGRVFAELSERVEFNEKLHTEVSVQVLSSKLKLNISTNHEEVDLHFDDFMQALNFIAELEKTIKKIIDRKRAVAPQFKAVLENIGGKHGLS